jgi:hypothetical protein
VHVHNQRRTSDAGRQVKIERERLAVNTGIHDVGLMPRGFSGIASRECPSEGRN